MTRIQRPDENLYFNHPIDQNAAYELMSMPLEDKEYESYVKLTEWYIAWEGKCYVSFSGGKDSTVLAYLTAQCFMENEWFKTPLVLCFFLSITAIRLSAKRYLTPLKMLEVAQLVRSPHVFMAQNQLQ